MVTTMGLLERLQKDVVLVAEGYLFELERRGYLKAGPYVPEVVLDNPAAVTELHREFLHAGSDVMLALTYYAHRDKLRAIGREGDLELLNRQALALARGVANEGDALLAGNISNTWVFDADDAKATGAVVRAMYDEQVRWAVEEGADFILAETLDYLGEALIAIEVIKSYGLPAVVNFGSVFEGGLKDGFSFEEACRIAQGHGADVVGLNCSRGPRTMLPLIEQIRATVDGYVSACPVPYRTTHEQPSFQTLREAGGERGFPIALDPFAHTRFEMADFAVQARDLGVRFIGICCGAAPHHVRAMAEALGRTVPSSRYSPDISLHPMLGSRVQERDRSFRGDWRDD
jgi:betaine-homocysteine S-methyltransferase